jgi:hypothetical protein
MAIQQLNDSTTFLEWKNITNQISLELGDLDILNTTANTNLVVAINEVSNISSNNNDDIGNLNDLTTSNQTNLVVAINEVDANVTTNTDGVTANSNDIGDLTTLTTTDKSSLVNAINEVDANVTTNSTDIATNSTYIGDLTTLTTTDKSSLVNAINEVDANAGDLTNLATTDKSSLVNAINEVGSSGDGSSISINLLHNHGTFIQEVGIIQSTQTFSYEEMFRTVDTATISADPVGKFLDNDAILQADINTLFIAMGRSIGVPQQGQSFYIADITSANSSQRSLFIDATPYLLSVLPNVFMGKIGDYVTAQFYIRSAVSTDKLGINNSKAGRAVYINDILQQSTTDTAYDVSSWTKVTIIDQLSTTKYDYIDDIFPLYLINGGATYQFALPSLFPTNYGNSIPQTGAL